MTSVHDIESALWQLAPRELARSWDNVGLLVGRPDREVRRVLVALDITEAVAEEAEALGADLIVSHHPVMNCHWHMVQTLRSDDLQGRLLRRLVSRDLSAICMHTNLDAAQGGVNDALAAALDLRQVELLEEEEGIVRMGLLPAPEPLPAFLSRVRAALSPNGIRYVDGGRAVCRVAVGGGACGGSFRRAAERGCDAFVTADVKYDQFLDSRAMGLSLIDAGHFPTEDVVCPVLAAYLRERFPDLKVAKSAVHREAVQYHME